MQTPDLFDDNSAALVAGVDEVGRGPLAGDVVAAAVILNGAAPTGVTDSKALSAGRREALAEVIRESALCWSVGRASVTEIDELNILEASLLAMRRLWRVKYPTHSRSGRWYRLPRWPYDARAIVKGDLSEPVIGAASILAKVTRDAEMLALHQTYPGYGFDRHKGYPTQAHLSALQTLGVSPAHRRSFGPVKRLLAAPEVG